MSNLNVGYAGMTHLGVCSSVAAAARGVFVTCYDSSQSRVDLLNDRRQDIEEPDLLTFMEEYSNNLYYTTSIESLSSCDLIFISLDVPTDEQGNSNLDSLRLLVSKIDQSICVKIPIVLLSQVPPGFCRSLSLSLGRVLYSQVETLVFGQAVLRAYNPERIIYGCADPDENPNSKYIEFLTLFDCPILPMRYESAELTKIAINCFLVSSIAVTNTLAELSEKVGADWSEILPALKLDRRIGEYAYLNPGLGIAGGNLERDLRTVTTLAGQFGTDSSIVNAWKHNSDYRRDWVLRLLFHKIFVKVSQPKIAIWGLSYKENTNSIKNSQSLYLIDALNTFDLAIYDPIVPNTVISARGFQRFESAIDAVNSRDILIIMTPWEQFKSYNVNLILSKMKSNIIIDPYGVLDCRFVKADIEYYRLGVSSVFV